MTSTILPSSATRVHPFLLWGFIQNTTRTVNRGPSLLHPSVRLYPYVSQTHEMISYTNWTSRKLGKIILSNLSFPFVKVHGLSCVYFDWCKQRKPFPCTGLLFFPPSVKSNVKYSWLFTEGSVFLVLSFNSSPDVFSPFVQRVTERFVTKTKSSL